MTARDDVLARIRAALEPPAPTSDPTSSANATQIVRAYRTAGDQPPGSPELLDLFESRIKDYRGFVHRTSVDDAGAEVVAAVAEHMPAGHALVLPPGLLDAWPDVAMVDRDMLVDDGSITVKMLDDSGGVVTGCALAIAETGTIVLDGSPDQGRRALTLVPDVHVCIVRANHVVASVPEAIARLDPTRPQTWISGPSATSDIELQRVEGVHGPRALVVVLVD
jgi:L-lactate dehydrogenase complex protein LldG